MGTKKNGPGKKAHYTAYNSMGKFSTNRKAKLARHMKLHSKDAQTAKAASATRVEPRRSKPGPHSVSKATKEFLQLEAASRRRMNDALFKSKKHLKDKNGNITTLLNAKKQLAANPTNSSKGTKKNVNTDT